MHRLFLVTLVCLAKLNTLDCAAQQPSPTSNFLEKSRVFNTLPNKNLVFEAQIAPHIFLFQNLNERSTADGFAFSFSVTPMVRLRMLSTASNPVKTPSYMPKGNLQAFYLKRLTRGASEIEKVQSPRLLLSLQTILGHHSNGQQGCLFANHERIDGKCVALDPSAELTINRETGSFSTNYVRPEFFVKYITLNRNLVAKSSFAAGIGFEFHPRDFGPGGISRKLQDRYGPYRLQLTLEYEKLNETFFGKKFPSRFESKAFVMRINQTPKGVSNYVFQSEVSVIFEKIYGYGIFVRYYYGQDYYNLSFEDNRNMVQVGLVFDAGSFVQLDYD